jgi:hypothetical protein
MMGTFDMVEGNDGKPVYLRTEKDQGVKIYMYYIKKKGLWNIGKPIGYDPAWMHVEDAASVPEEINTTWYERKTDGSKYYKAPDVRTVETQSLHA